MHQLADGRSESVARTRLVQSGLPPAVPQFRVETDRTRVRLDLAWPERQVAWEIDGRAKYFRYRPTDEALYRERQREKRLQNLGWMVFRSDWRGLFAGWEEACGQLRAMLEHRRPTRLPQSVTAFREDHVVLAACHPEYRVRV